jgi:hypothetical protein
MTIAPQQEISYSIRKSILYSNNNNVILLTTMPLATLIASCNAGQFSHSSLQTGWKKKENSKLERYLSTMSGI